MKNKILYYMEKIMKNVDIKKELINDNNSTKPLVCFRGESIDYGDTKLMPSLFRNDSGILLEKELIELLSDYDIPQSKDNTKLSKTIAGQHFLQISRLLDITFSILPALYFASDNQEDDGFVYTFVFPESFSPNSDYLNHYYDSLVANEFFPYSKDFKVITHSYNNERLKMQSGGFILFGGEAFSKIPEEYYCEPTRILAEDKVTIRAQLSKYFNLNESTIFPEKDKRKDPIMERLSYIKRNRSNKGDFLDVELEYCFRRIEFETSLKQEDPKKILRFLRKEKANLFTYIDKNYKSESEKYKKRKIIEDKFTIIESGVGL